MGDVKIEQLYVAIKNIVRLCCVLVAEQIISLIFSHHFKVARPLQIAKLLYMRYSMFLRHCSGSSLF